MRPTRWQACACLQVLLVLACLGVQPAPAEPVALRLEEAVAGALRDHPALKAVGHEVLAAQAGLRAAQARANPEIVIAPTLLGSQGTPEAVSISQPLELSGIRSVRKRIGGAAVDAALAEREILEREVSLRVREAYWDAALAQATVVVEGQNLEHAQTLGKAAQRQVELGNQPRMQQIKTDVEVARAQQQLIAAEARAAQAMSSLSAAMGAPSGTVYALVDRLSFLPTEVDGEALAAEALRSRPELRLAQAGVDGARGEIDAARLARKPDVAVTYWQETFGSSGGIGVSVNLPLLDWGGSRQKQAQAKSLADAREASLAQAEQRIALDVRQAVIALRSAEAQVRELEERVVKQSEQLAEITAIGYREGALNLLDVLDARRTLRAVQLEYETTLAEHMKARAVLEWASTRGLASPATTTTPAPSAPVVRATPAAAPAAPVAMLTSTPAQPAQVGVTTVRRLPATGPEARPTTTASANRTVMQP